MADQLAFNEETALHLEKQYSSADIVRRRKLVSEALAATAGERILDVGCGPGFYVAELAKTVGEDGLVTGVDPSGAMLAAADRRTAALVNVALLGGEATDIPMADASCDAALSVQVYEYVTDIDAALAEMYRVLRPGGRLVLWDVDWTTLSWFSTDADRMARVLLAWDEHLVHPALPQRLAADMGGMGFVDVDLEGHAFVNTDAGPDTYSGLVIPLIEQFVGDHGVTADEAVAWRSELDALSEAHEYFFSVTQFCFSAMKPD